MSIVKSASGVGLSCLEIINKDQIANKFKHCNYERFRQILSMLWLLTFQHMEFN